jgi:predicted phage gp36 major capsid-like protein
MPKVDDIQKIQKLNQQLADLKSDKEVEARKMKAVLSTAQQKAIKDKWNAQLKLRDEVKARTKEQQQAAGYKSKREVQIEVYEDAIND